AGSVAVWARGGPALVDDLDFVLPPGHVEPALEVLSALGMRREDPPEDWLVKAWDGPVLVDLIFLPSGLAIDDALFARADVLDVHGISMPVMAPEDVVIAKVMSMHEHYLDFAGLLDLCRPVREQVDWEEVRERTSGPYAKSFLVLADELGLTAAGPRPPPGTVGFPPAERRPARSESA
ncbi:MAG: nucleotidyltransferase family protein, partial [Thermoleophilaceae bacterium]